MKKLLIVSVVSLLLLAGCTTPTLYSWSNYSVSSYNYLKNRDEKSMAELVKTYDRIINNQTGTRHTVPPGVYADYGFILIQSGKVAEGLQMLKMEVSLYPESAQFVNNIIKTYEKQ